MAVRWFDDRVRERFRAKTERGLSNAGLAVEALAKQLAPVLTGNLRRSGRKEPHAGAFRQGDTTYVLVKFGGVNKVGYALHVELGTRRMAARPYLLPALRQVGPRIPSIMRTA